MTQRRLSGIEDLAYDPCRPERGGHRKCHKLSQKTSYLGAICNFEMVCRRTANDWTRMENKTMAAFEYQEMFPLGDDDTPYRQIRDTDGEKSSVG